MPTPNGSPEPDVVIIDSLAEEQRFNAQLRALYFSTKWIERLAKTNNLPIDSIPTKYFKYFLNLQTVRDGDLSKLPFDIAVDKGKAKFFEVTPKTFLAIELTAYVVDKIGPRVIGDMEACIAQAAEREALFQQHLSPLQRQVWDGDSFAEDMAFVSNQWKTIYAAAHTWRNLPALLNKAAVPEGLKSAIHNLQDAVHRCGDALVTLDFQREPEFDTNWPSTFSDVRAMLLYLLGGPLLKYAVLANAPTNSTQHDSTVITHEPIANFVANSGESNASATSQPAETNRSADNEPCPVLTTPPETSSASNTHSYPHESSHPAKKESIQILPFMQTSSGNTMVGVTARNLVPHYDVNAGFQVSDQLITNLMNDTLLGKQYAYDEVTAGGKTFFYSINGRSYNYDMKMTVGRIDKKGQWCDCGDKTYPVKLDELKFNAEKNKPIIEKAIRKHFLPCVQSYVDSSTTTFTNDRNNALQNGNIVEANRIHEAFFKIFQESSFKDFKRQSESIITLVQKNKETIALVETLMAQNNRDQLQQELQSASEKQIFPPKIIELPDFNLSSLKSKDRKNFKDDIGALQRKIDRINTLIADKADDFEVNAVIKDMRDHIKKVDSLWVWRSFKDLNKKSAKQVNTAQEQLLKLDSILDAIPTKYSHYLTDVAANQTKQVMLQEALTGFDVNAKSQKENVVENASSETLKQLSRQPEYDVAANQTKQVMLQEALTGFDVNAKSQKENVVENASSETLKQLSRQPEYAIYSDRIIERHDGLTKQNIVSNILPDDLQSYETAYQKAQEIINPETRVTFLSELSEHLCVNAALQEMSGQLEQCRGKLQIVLSHDPSHALAKELMRSSYASEIDRQITNHKNQHTTLSKQAMPDMRMRTDEAMEKLKAIADLSEKHATEIKLLSEKEKLYAEKEEPDLRVEMAGRQWQQDQKNIAIMELQISHFKVHTLQLLDDAVFKALDVVLPYCFSDEHYQKICQKMHRAADALLQIPAHHYSWQLNELQSTLPSTFRVPLNVARYPFLALQFTGAVLNTFDLTESPCSKKIAAILDNYALPVAQLSLSIGFMCIAPLNFNAGALSFAPELLLKIPEVRDALLMPNSHDCTAYARFAVGMTLHRLNEIKNDRDFLSINTLTQFSGYVGAYLNTLLAWLERGLTYFISQDTVVALFNAVPHADISEVAGNLFLALRLVQMVMAAYQTGQSLQNDWERYWRKLDIQRLCNKHIAARTFENATTPSDGNCLFYAISYYVEHSHQQLREMAVNYEREHRAELDIALISENENIDEHIRNIALDAAWGTHAEIYSLAKVLNRPIIVIIPGARNFGFDHSHPVMYTLPGNPIFISLQGNHYTALLPRGEHYFEADYARSLAAQRARMPANVVMINFQGLSHTLQQNMRTLDSISDKTEVYQEKLTEGNRHMRECEQLITAVNANITLLSAKARQPTPKNIQGVNFIENTGLTPEEETAFARLVGNMN